MREPRPRLFGYRRHHAGGDDDSGVSTRGLRRRGRPRHRARRAATPFVRSRRPLHGRTARGCVRGTARSRVAGRQSGSVDVVGGSDHGRRREPGHRGAFAHVVRRAGRPPRRAPVRHPARADRAFARADAAVEGRTARRRLPGVVMGGEDSGRGGRRGDRGQFGHARRCVAHLSVIGPEPGACGSQRDRHRCLVCGTAGAGRVGARRTRRRHDAADRRVRRAGSPARRVSHI